MVDEGHPQIPLEEPALAEIEENYERKEREERGVTATEVRSRVTIHSKSELRPPTRTDASSRRDRAENRVRAAGKRLLEEERLVRETTPRENKRAEAMPERAKRRRDRGTAEVEAEVEGPSMVTRRKTREGQVQRMSGWLPLTEDRQGFAGIEVRPSPSRGGGLGVYVSENYILEEGCVFPYFGAWGFKSPAEIDTNQYLVGPYPGRRYVDGNPKVIANDRHGEGSSLWAGARVNQANTPQERNCRMLSVPREVKQPRREEYASQYAEPVRCAMWITRPLVAGEEILTNYGWDVDTQRERRCGYTYYYEKISKKGPTQKVIVDEEEVVDPWGDEEGEESEEEL
jgi:hypothetical protein